MDSVKARVDEGWHFTFLRANQDAIQEGGRMGVAADSSLTFGASPTGAREAVHAASASMGRMRGGESKTPKYTEVERRCGIAIDLRRLRGVEGLGGGQTTFAEATCDLWKAVGSTLRVVRAILLPEPPTEASSQRSRRTGRIVDQSWTKFAGFTLGQCGS
jgi:hypothetical protein